MYIQGGGLLSNRDFSLSLFNSKNLPLIKNNKSVEYYNIPAAFDIETSSFYEGEKKPENKRGLMYIWQLGIGNIVTTGRTWEQCIDLIKIIRKILSLGDNRRLVIYVHNLPYEFQFMRKWIEWDKIFILKERQPVYAISNGIEFRCSLKLSGGKSLENIGKDLVKYKVKKMTGYLDYSQIRTPLTPLTDKELLYCENDIRVLLSYIQEKIEQDGDITKIPLTNTGYVRNYCRKMCYRKWRFYRNCIEQLTMTAEEYSQLKRAFRGGSVHANAKYTRMILENVGSHDFGSSYPSVMVLEKFPMTKPELITDGINDSELRELLLHNCCLFDIEFFGLLPRLHHEHPLSRYKCYICEGAIFDNGRVVMAEHIGTTVTEQDYFIYSEFYTWDRIVIKNLRVFKRNYLPKPFVLSILTLYNDKTKLKGDESQVVNYMIKKNMANSSYGMSVTDPVRKEFDYIENLFIEKQKDIESAINRYNTDIKRFLYYPWGVWITAYARANLFSGIIELGDDYVYSDTDAVKSLNTEKHLQYFSDYNKNILSKIDRAASYHGIDVSMFKPKTIKGKEKPIGLWENEGVYEKFKTLGAKRYLTFKHKKETIKEGDITIQLTEPVTEITLAGSNKNKTATYLRSTLKPFENFDNGLTVPKESSGRLIVTYIDHETEGDIKDINGVPYHYHELSSVHMEPSDYNLTMTEEYIRLIECINELEGY